MTYVIWIFALFAILGLLLWNRVKQQPIVKTAFVYVIAASLAFAAAWFTGLLPQMLVVSLGVFVASVLYAIYERKLFTRTLLISLPFFAGTLLAFFLSQSKTPDPGIVVIDDIPVPIPGPIKPEVSIREQLAAQWSTEDPFADWPVTRLMAKLCVIAYKPPVDARTELEAMGFKSETINSGSMNGYVLSVDDSAVIILRGTELGLPDVLQDLYFISNTTDHGELHGGFNTGYTPMHEQVQKLLDRYKPKRVWITGHSLGGALSIVCAYRLIQDGKYPVFGIMTFGQPMVVKTDLSQYIEPKLKGKYVHFVNNMDPIVNIVQPYVHFGHLVWRNGNRIIRSRVGGMMASAPAPFGLPEKQADADTSLQPMTPDEFKQFLKEEKHASQPQKDSQGRPVYLGSFRQIGDHYMLSYMQMVDTLLGKAGTDSQMFLDE